LSREQSAELLAGRMVSPAFTMHPLHPSLFDDASEEGYPFMATSLAERLVVTAQVRDPNLETQTRIPKPEYPNLDTLTERPKRIIMHRRALLLGRSDFHYVLSLP
jgi:hypothetical protein